VSRVRRGVALLGIGVALALPSLARAAPPSDPYALTPKLAHVARVVAPTWARREPGKVPAVAKVSPLAEWGGGEVQYLVLRSRLVDGRRWLRVRLPERPNDAAGWIPADVTRDSTTPWRIVVSTAEARVTVRRAGRRVVSFPAVVGKPATPTPHGLFAIDEPIRQPPGSELGPWALFLTAHSRPSTTTAAAPAASPSTAAPGRCWPIRWAPRHPMGASGSRMRGSAGWQGSR
jgi:hypothetical protein